MARNSFRALCIYFIVYAIAQGIMDAYEEALEQPFLDHHGVSIDLVGLAQTVDFLPWCFKFVWAIPSDSYNFLGFGHRRPYVVLGILLGFAAFFALTQFDPGQYLWAYMLCMSIRNIGVAIADCAVDGLSVDCQLDTEAGAISGWMSLGRTAGTVLAAIVATKIAADNGDNYSLGIMVSAFFMFIPLPANWFILEEWIDEVAYEDKIENAAGAELAKVGAILAANTAFTKHTAMDSDNPKPNMTMAEAAAIIRKEAEEDERLQAKGLAALDPEALALDEAHDKTTMAKVYGMKRMDSFKREKEEAHAIMDERESVDKARKALVRRKSFVAKVAENVGFDWEMLQETLSQKHVYLFLVYLLLTNMGVAMANFSLTAWVHEERGFHIDEVGIVMSVMSIGCFMASLPMGYAFDYIPNKRSTMFFAAFCCGLCNTALLFCHTKAEVYVGLWGFGAAHGVIYTVQCSMARILADVRIAAAFFGIVNSTYNISHALGTLFGGPIAAKYGLETNFLLGAITSFLAVPFCFLLPEEQLRVSHDDAEGGKMKVLKHRMDFKRAEARKTALNTTAVVLEQADDLTKARLRALSNYSHNPAYGLDAQNKVKIGSYVLHLPSLSGSSEETAPHTPIHKGSGCSGVHAVTPVAPYTPLATVMASPRAKDAMGVIQAADLTDVVRRNPISVSAAMAVMSPHRSAMEKAEMKGLQRRPSFKEKVMVKLEEANEQPVVAPRTQQTVGHIPQPTWIQRRLGATVEPPKPKPAHSGKYRRNSAAAAGQLARQTGLPLSQVAGPRPPTRDGEHSIDTDSTDDPAGTADGGSVAGGLEKNNPFGAAAAGAGVTSSSAYMMGMGRQPQRFAVVDYATGATAASAAQVSALPMELGEGGSAVARNPLRLANGQMVSAVSPPPMSISSVTSGGVDRRARAAMMGAGIASPNVSQQLNYQ